jgi:sterol desaturase/sphingolipid hydroxylase (fatty acid hydroxylase superfamily)
MQWISAIGIPLVLAIFFIELLIVLAEKTKAEKAKDMTANLVIGLVTLGAGLFMKGISFVVFSWIYDYAFFQPPVSAGLWVIGFFSCDLVSYLYHLLSHKTRLFWAAHVTHHSSLYFNISTGFRVSCIHVLYRFLFWSPLCLLGIPPIMILFFDSLTTLHNILIHTERIGKLGVLDAVFNTPSNHRVHHASNPQYLDKNLGGVLIIYDRVFGTYAAEKEKPEYGITHNIHSHNPVTILLHEYRDMFQALFHTKGWKQKLKILFSPPAVKPNEGG